MSIVHVSSLNSLSTVLEAPSVGTDLPLLQGSTNSYGRCGPCHQIAPRYEHLAKINPQVHFLKCDVDAAQDVARHYKISAMPTFIFLKNGKQVDMVRGADPSLEHAIKKHKSFTSDDTAFLVAQTKNAQSLASNLPPDSEVELAERERERGGGRLEGDGTWSQEPPAPTNNSRAGDAILCYSEALRLDPTNLVYRNNRAQAALQDKCWGMALADAATVVSKEPDNTKAWIRLGKALRALGKIDESINAFTAAAIASPSSAAMSEIGESECIKASGSGEPLPEEGSIGWDIGLRRTEALSMQLEEDYAKGKGVFAKS
ncbi:Thioredoxin domain-containing protein [Rhizoctonia solani AG-1 IA]|uniref:Thioredoxin domain-containing protein n=1 Tax=Thanatephorus cucumeris (strain AG1-IA) TaxID=983506 RepID=L8WVS4_THACA|nr:Thioredoxin domain-containing protein [Rhizoctonia solani AG-1 IA]